MHSRYTQNSRTRSNLVTALLVQDEIEAFGLFLGRHAQRLRPGEPMDAREFPLVYPG